MKRKSSILLIILICLSLVSLSLLAAGCSRAQAVDLMANVHAAEWPAAADAPGETFTASLSAFAWKLLQKSADNPGNILISPASVYLALAMTINGADGDTRDAMLETLSAQGLSVDELNLACRDWTTLLSRQDSKTTLNIANSIWYRTGFNADEAFLQTNADYFAAGARILDFSKPEAVDIINGWVKSNTNGKIEKILEEIGPAVVMYLINTIYFKSDWQTPFIKNFSAKGSFMAPDGDVDVQFMHRTGSMSYLGLGGNTGILLPYSDSQFAFFAILPSNGQDPRQLVLAQDSTFLGEVLGTAKTSDVKLTLPAFESSYTDSLLNELEKMGMGIAFKSGADFSLMNIERRKDLFISEIKHKTFIKLNETGTEAAAATLVEISKTSVEEYVYDVVFDRPFLYGIVDLLTGQPIFIGILEDPSIQ